LEPASKVLEPASKVLEPASKVLEPASKVLEPANGYTAALEFLNGSEARVLLGCGLWGEGRLRVIRSRRNEESD
jgi:hypothetical protein